MIPIGGNLTNNLEEVTETSRTYRLDFNNHRCAGVIDGLDAVKQAVHKILQTERFMHLIYDADYGFESQGLIGSNSGYAQSELKRRIREALLQDDRISDITDFETLTQGDAISVSFMVESIHGDYRTEVNTHV